MSTTFKKISFIAVAFFFSLSAFPQPIKGGGRPVVLAPPDPTRSLDSAADAGDTQMSDEQTGTGDSARFSRQPIDRDSFSDRPMNPSASGLSCALNQPTESLNELRETAISSLTNLQAAARQCAQELEAAAGPQPSSGSGSRIDNAIANLRTASLPTSPCLTTEQTISQRRQRLEGLMAIRSPATVEDPSAVDALSNHPLASDGSWKSFNLPTQAAELSDEYRSCAIFEGTTQYVNMNCLTAVDDVELYRATSGSASASSSAQNIGSNRCGARTGIPAEVGSAVATAIETVFSIVEGNPNCPAGPRAAISAMNLGVSVLSMTPVSPLVSLMAGIGQRLFNGIFGGNTRRAETALAANQWDITRRQTQCLFVALHKERIGCDTNATRIDQLQAATRAKQTKIDRLAQIQGAYQNAYRVERSSDDWNMCVTRANQLISRDSIRAALAEWGLTDVENAIRRPGAAAPGGAPGAVAPVTIVLPGGQPSVPPQADLADVLPLVDNVCQKYEAPNGAQLMGSVAGLRPMLDTLGSMCRNLRTNPDDPNLMDQLRTVFLSGGRPLSFRMNNVVSQLSANPQQASVIQNNCVREFQPAPARGQALFDMAALEGEIRAMGDPDADLRLATSDGRRVLQNDAGTSLFNNYRAAWTQDNGTRMNLTPRIEQLVTDLRNDCRSASPETALISQKANELHGSCLLNAGVYLYRRGNSPEFTSNEARDWGRNCDYFLRNEEYSPSIDNGRFTINPAPVADQYNQWQCNSFQNFDKYRNNLTSALQNRRTVAELCNRFDPDEARTRARNAAAGVSR